MPPAAHSQTDSDLQPHSCRRPHLDLSATSNAVSQVEGGPVAAPSRGRG